MYSLCSPFHSEPRSCLARTQTLTNSHNSGRLRCPDADTGKIHGADLCFSHIKIRQLGERDLQKILFVVRWTHHERKK
jgi:hypothetical protein